jgi:hypothetical protein
MIARPRLPRASDVLPATIVDVSAMSKSNVSNGRSRGIAAAVWLSATASLVGCGLIPEFPPLDDDTLTAGDEGPADDDAADGVDSDDGDGGTVGWGGTGGTGAAEEELPPPTLHLVLHDAPAEADQVWITVQEASVHHEGLGWITLSAEALTVDLLALQDGIVETLGLLEMPPGQYSQLRLVVTDASVVVAGETFPLTIPSGEQSGLKVAYDFELPECGAMTLDLDWDVAESLQLTPQGFKLAPVLHATHVLDVGACAGAGESGGEETAGEETAGEETAGEGTGGDAGTASEGTAGDVDTEGEGETGGEAETGAEPEPEPQ